MHLSRNILLVLSLSIFSKEAFAVDEATYRVWWGGTRCTLTVSNNSFDLKKHGLFGSTSISFRASDMTSLQVNRAILAKAKFIIELGEQNRTLALRAKRATSDELETLLRGKMKP